VHFTIYMYLYLYSYRREIARQLRMYAQLTRCFSAVAELLVMIRHRRNITKYGSSSCGDTERRPKVKYGKKLTSKTSPK